MQNQQLNNVVESAAGNLTSKMAYASAASTGLMGFIGSSSFAVITGFIIGIATFLMGWYYKSREDKRRDQRHELQMLEQKARIEHLQRNYPVAPPTQAEADSVY